MGVDVRILTAALVLLAATTTTSAQEVFGERCGYMNLIPRPDERPEIPPIHYEGLTWNQRPLVPAADRLDLCMDAFILDQMVPNRGNQFIFLEEEIEGHVPIAKLNYNGESAPTVQLPMLTGQFNLLLPIITRIDGDWHVVITNRQDYETPGMQFYSFNIAIPGEAMVVTVSLMIVNIDDNDPIIEMVAPCEIAEDDEPGVERCRYTVSDLDGRLSTSAMHYKIQSDRGDERMFELIRQNEPGEWRWCYMVLVLKESLDFAHSPLHIFRVWAFDSKLNSHDVSMMVEVENVESRPPQWVTIFAMQQLDEKIRRSYRVRAIDGDTGINSDIHYRLVTEKGEEDLFELTTATEEDGGGVWLHVGPIDRDALEKEVFNLSIIAYKYGKNDVEGSPSYETPAHIVIIIDDINDQRPEPLRADGIYNIDILEETAMTLDLEEFGFHDRDLGPRAQYRVHLESVYPEGVHTAFYVAPEVGYQRQSFILGTQDHHRLDYDNKEINFKKIQIWAVAVDMDDNSMIGVATININLINWNDELPIFELALYEVKFPETMGKDFHVGTVLAKDLDVDDRVEHSLMGNAIDFLCINKTSGEIFVRHDDVFNYHRQNEVFVQVRAVDTLGEGPHHTATTQLVIQLEDINNTPPVLRLPRTSPSVHENEPHGFEITRNVTATDPDTTAELWFEIDWGASYATKQGRETPAIEFHDCVEILTRYPDENNTGVAYGVLEVREIRTDPVVTIDYEEFEVLYLRVRVRDRKTEIGDDYDESTFTITIIDLNDNWPIWSAGQLEQQFRVREVALSGVVIGSMHAFDIDGPLYNQVRYTIEPKDGTPPDLVAIDFNTGQITVLENQRIDADEPKRFNLYYTVTASDKCSMKNQSECPDDKTYWDTTADIAIQIIDTNNKVPVLETEKFNTTVWIYEDAVTGDEVVTLIATDLDRDLPNSNVSFTINFLVNTPSIRNFFEVDLVTGQVRVHYTTPDTLDRDGDEPEHTIFFTIIDNFASEGDGNRNQIEGQVHVILKDVNDNAPELPSPEDFPPWTVSESALEGIRIEPEIFAPDRDEPGTDNSRVAYAILGLTTERDIVVPNLFNMNTIEKDRGIDQTGELVTAMPLQGYWGTYDILIQAYDHGDPRLQSNETYQVVVRPYNFHEPEFVFPKPGSVIRLSRERAIVSGVLTVVGAAATPLERISATDEDGLHAGTVTFSVEGDDAAADYFDVWNDGENSGMLTLTQPLPEGLQEFQLTIRATDGGDEPGPKSTDTTVTVAFIPQGEPVFLINTQDVAFIELVAGTLERFELNPATDPKNFLCDENVDCYVIHYTIIDGNAAGHFALDGNVLFLRSQLNRDEHVTHTLRVAASNTPGVTTAQPASTLTVTVTVREANPRPHFERPLYTAGISTTDAAETDRPLITVQATHTEGLVSTYSIDQESMEVDPSLESVQDRAFELNPVTGELRRMIQATATMHGMFEFDIVATDTNGATGKTHVKVYLISSRNRAYFTFYNEQDLVITHRDFIADTFSRVYNMTCNIDQIMPLNDQNGVAITTQTQVMAHFIRDDLPVSADEISELQSDLQLFRDISMALQVLDLSLTDVSAGAPFVPGGDNALAVYILAGLAGLLAVLCIVLLVSFIIRNRSLNRRIAALSMTKYSSVDSGLNRVGLAAAPGTNKHAVEGSNPIWNETIKAPDFDAISEQSNDSDLIGIEDDPQFRNDYFPPEFDRAMRNSDAENPEEIGARNPIANHENNFGFNTSPFSPEFANSQLRR